MSNLKSVEQCAADMIVNHGSISKAIEWAVMHRSSHIGRNNPEVMKFWNDVSNKLKQIKKGEVQ